MDLTTRYLGLELRSPLVASASPLWQDVNAVQRVAEAGAGAVVLYSLFEEEVRRQQLEDYVLADIHEHSFGEAQTYFPDLPATGFAGERPYLDHLARCVGAVDIPVIASLNGASVGGWTSIAKSMEDAGAAAIELNIYAVPGTVHTEGAEVEQRHRDIVAAVTAEVSIPVAVKLSPYFSATGAMARSLELCGAAGLVLFNRFLQPEIDVDRLRVRPATGLSTPADARLPRTWIALLRHQLGISLAATSGVESADDVVAYLLAGADAVMTTSALLRHGPGYAAALLDGVGSWLSRKGFSSAAQARGLLAVPADVDSASYERAGYVAALQESHGTYGQLTAR
jgi:dihydroorotate dehydrogenase (fumarate)